MRYHVARVSDWTGGRARRGLYCRCEWGPKDDAIQSEGLWKSEQRAAEGLAKGGGRPSKGRRKAKQRAAEIGAKGGPSGGDGRAKCGVKYERVRGAWHTENISNNAARGGAEADEIRGWPIAQLPFWCRRCGLHALIHAQALELDHSHSRSSTLIHSHPLPSSTPIHAHPRSLTMVLDALCVS